MIPERKKTPEEIAALRGDPGVRLPAAKETEIPEPEEAPTLSLPLPGEPVIHLEVPAPLRLARTAPAHTLRKHEVPLAPAPDVTHRIPLPARRHGSAEIARVRKLQSLSQLNAPGMDPASQLRAQTSSPFLHAPGYLSAVAAAVAVYQSASFIAPLALLSVSLLITVFIALRKPRSRHHAALIFIVIFLTSVFGGLHYASLFQHGP